MAEQIAASRNNLYQSQWWARLAAISEKRDTTLNTLPVEKEQSNFREMLTSLFPADQGSRLISIFVKTN
jgi:hypothetical protein